MPLSALVIVCCAQVTEPREEATDEALQDMLLEARGGTFWQKATASVDAAAKDARKELKQQLVGFELSKEDDEKVTRALSASLRCTGAQS